MIYLLHGTDTVSSRNFLLRLKEKYQSAATIDLKKLKGELTVPSVELFGQNNLLVLENALPKTPESFLNSVSGDVVVWLPETLDTVPNWIEKNIHFHLPEKLSTFKLADSVFSGQEKQSLMILENLIRNNTSSEFIVGALVRQLKSINLVLEGQEDMVSKSIFVLKKCKDQARYWSGKRLKLASMYFLKADLTIKKGLLNSSFVLPKLVLDLCNLAKN